MEWRCVDCHRRYDDPPERCTCGAVTLEPDDGEDRDRDRFSLSSLRRRLLDPAAADRSLVREEPYVTLVFRLCLAIAVFGMLLFAALLLL